MHLERWLSSHWSSELTPLNIYLERCTLSLNCDPISRQRAPVQSTQPAGIIYINYEFMQTSLFPRIIISHWCGGAFLRSSNISNLNYPSRAPCQIKNNQIKYFLNANVKYFLSCKYFLIDQSEVLSPADKDVSQLITLSLLLAALCSIQSI